MRNKILIDLACKGEINLYDVIAEKGEFKKIVFSQDSLNYLAEIGYFKHINFRLGLSIDIYEEETICEPKTIIDLIEETRNFKNNYSDKSHHHIYEQILEALILTKKLRSCIYFIF